MGVSYFNFYIGSDSTMTLTRSLTVVLLVVLCILAWIMFYQLETYSGFFLAEEIAEIFSDLNKHGYFPNLFSSGTSTNIPGHYLLVSMIYRLTDLPINNLQYIPIVSIIVSVMYYALSRQVFGALPSLFLATVITYRGLFWPSTASVGVKGFGLILYIAFLILLFIMSRKRNIKVIILLILVFVSNHFIDYTAEMWMISTLALYEVVFLIRWKKISDITSKNNFSISLLTAFIVVFIGLKNIVYTTYIPNITYESFYSSFYAFLANIFPFLDKPILYDYYYILPSLPIVSIMNRTFMILLLLPVTIKIIILLIEMIKHRYDYSKNPVFISQLSLCILGTAITELIVYGIFGYVRIGYVNSFFPLLGAFFVFNILSTYNLRLNVNKIFLGYLSLLLIFSVTVFIISIASNTFPPQLSTTDGKPGTDWLFSKISKSDMIVLSDLDTLGKLKLEGSFVDKKITTKYYNPYFYANVINKTSNKNNFLDQIDFVVVDLKSDKGVQGWNWELYEPLTFYINKIDNNGYLCKLYNDSNIAIYEKVKTKMILEAKT